MNKLTATEKAYIAGIIDGEGCIGIYRTGGKRKDAARLSLRVMVGMTDKDILYWLKETTGVGGVWHHAFPKGNRKESWQWAVRSRQAAELLFELVPYTRVKEEQSIIALTFANTMSLVPGCHRLSKATVRKREELAAQIRKLNKRGINAT